MRSFLLIAAAAVVAAPLPLAAQQAPTRPPAAATTAAAAAPTTAPAAPTRPRLTSWFADRREFAVGDVLTILVDDYTISTAVKDDLASDRRRRGFDFGLQRPGASTSIGIDSRNDAESQRRGEARRENRFQSEMSVRVDSVSPNGTIRVKGKRLIEVDRGQQQVELSGWVRPQDIAPSNVVESSRIADATITYLSPGPVGKPKQGVISKVIGIVWP